MTRVARASGATHALAEERREALPVLLDALVAVIPRDVLDPLDFDDLYGPWRDTLADDGNLGP
jgi:hypothetical protein